MSKENILNYQVEMIDYHSDGLSKPNTSLNYQYTMWELDEKILQVMGELKNTVRWIGNGQSSYLDSFIYILMSISLKNQELITRLKEHIYQLSRKYLQKSNQKLIVQFLCLIQYTKDKFNFLRKYPDVTKILVSILKFFENQVINKQNLKVSNFSLESPVKTKRKQCFSIFCSKFNFISVSHPNQYTYRFKSGQQCIYLIVQKQCFFVVQKAQIQIDQKQTLIERKLKKFKNSTPRFCSYTTGDSNNKSKSEKKRAQNHMIHKSKKSQNLLDFLNSNSSNDCSIEQIHRTLKMIEGQQNPQKNLFDRLKTQPHIQRQNKKYIYNKFGKKQKSTVKLIKRFRDSQQKRKQLWLKLQEQYYQKKQQICKKIKLKKKLKYYQSPKLNLSKSKNQGVKSQKQRKTSFNSFSGLSVVDYHDSDYYQSEFDMKSTTKSQQANENSNSNAIIKLKKISFKESPHGFKEMLRKKNSNQNIITQDNRLSVIQEENRLKFWNHQKKTHTLERSPKIASINSSNRETLDPNVVIKFNYMSKNQQNLSNPPESNVCFQKIRYYGSPIRV